MESGDRPGSRLVERAERIYQRADEGTGGILGIARDAFTRFNKVRAPGAAASLAYYALFSLFPLLLFLVAALSYVLEDQAAYDLVVEFFTNLIPASEELVTGNLQSIIANRGTVGLIGLVSLLWSGLGMFTTLSRNVNRAWPEAEDQGLVRQHVVALVIVGVIVALLVLSILSNAVLDVLRRINARLGGLRFANDALSVTLSSGLAPFVLTFLLFWGLYRLVPNTAVRWRDAFWGALLAAPAWVIAGDLFSWYLSSGLATYDLIYGSLGAVVALMFWSYLGGYVILLGAHLSAAVARRKNPDARGSDH